MPSSTPADKVLAAARALHAISFAGTGTPWFYIRTKDARMYAWSSRQSMNWVSGFTSTRRCFETGGNTSRNWCESKELPPTRCVGLSVGGTSARARTRCYGHACTVNRASCANGRHTGQTGRSRSRRRRALRRESPASGTNRQTATRCRLCASAKRRRVETGNCACP
jgi:hypothetical protein